jgi:UDP-N-acetylmuramyl pentapeptide phosphotransferase/UDP-N-acetylglucosamine-1-phosphate transferase
MLVILLTPLFIKIAPRVGLIDYPNQRCIHKTPMPLGGGTVIFISFNFVTYLIYPYFWPNFTGKLDINWWWAFFISSSMLLIVGLIDDKLGMSPLVKLLGQACSALCFCLLSGYQVNLLNIDLGFFGSLLFVLIWTIAIINAFNLIDGLDGLCSGLAMISSIGLAVVFVFRGFSGDALVCLALVGSCLGFLRYNFFPARVFLGDTGSMFLGFTLAIISLQAGGKGSVFILIAAFFFVAGVPVIDTLLAIWRRSIRKMLAEKNGKNTVKIMQADREHLHHRLLNSGLQQHHVAYTLYAVNVAIITVGIIYFFSKEISTGLFLIIFIIVIYLLFRYVLQVELWETSRLFARSYKEPFITQFTIVFYLSFDLLWMAFIIWLSDSIVLKGVSSFHSISDFSIHLPAWIMPVFTLLFISNTYIKVWQNSFFKDYLFLSIAVISGCLFSLGVNFILKTGDDFYLINQAALFCFFNLIGIVGIRIPHHFLREWGISSSNPNHAPNINNQRNILIYGAGVHGGLYLRERYLKYPDELGTVNIIGFIDDNDRLRNQYTFGLKVLGNVNDINVIADKFTIDEIVLTTTISTANFLVLQETASLMNIKLLEWKVHIIPVGENK